MGGAVLVAIRRGGVQLLAQADGQPRWAIANGGDAVRGGPVARADGGAALPRWDGTVLLAGPGRAGMSRLPGTFRRPCC